MTMNVIPSPIANQAYACTAGEIAEKLVATAAVKSVSEVVANMNFI